jgi:predicted ATPase
MLTSITLQNFKSFGAEQIVPLRPISVLVGPNNSGKSSFLSVGRFVRDAAYNSPETFLGRHGGERFLLHRPPVEDGLLKLGWATDAGRYETSLRINKADIGSVRERLKLQNGNELPNPRVEAFSALQSAIKSRSSKPSEWQPIVSPLVRSRDIKLSLEVLRRDSEFATTPTLGSDGSQIAAVLSLWRSAYPERAEMLDEILRECLPEIRFVLAMPAPQGNQFRLWFRQVDGEMFDAEHVSDGVLLFTALAMHAIDAEPGSVLFLEEPEQSIHPRRIHEVFELFQRIVEKQQCQFVIATHSPILVNELRDDPEAILLFRRSEQGSVVTSLAEVPRLVEALHKAEPGELLANGFFNDPL